MEKNEKKCLFSSFFCNYCYHESLTNIDGSPSSALSLSHNSNFYQYQKIDTEIKFSVFFSF